jgi:hypothetical protein
MNSLRENVTNPKIYRESEYGRHRFGLTMILSDRVGPATPSGSMSADNICLLERVRNEVIDWVVRSTFARGSLREAILASINALALASDS